MYRKVREDSKLFELALSLSISQLNLKKKEKRDYDNKLSVFFFAILLVYYIYDITNNCYRLFLPGRKSQFKAMI